MTKQDLMDIIVKVAPGSPLREGVDYILDAGIGALIVIGYDDEVEKVRDGGFFIDCDYTPVSYTHPDVYKRQFLYSTT